LIWGDFDGDGKLDLLAAGHDEVFAGRILVYRNLGNGAFIQHTNTDLPTTTSGAAWGDFDGDGDLDAAVSGYRGAPVVGTVFRNDGQNQFVPILTPLQSRILGSVLWGDYDGDGRADLIQDGSIGNGTFERRLYHAEASGVFLEVKLTLPGDGTAGWGDFDNDWDLDLLISSARGNVIYRNEAGNGFISITAGLSGALAGSAAFGDFNNEFGV
jgi:hypothetical protein